MTFFMSKFPSPILLFCVCFFVNTSIAQVNNDANASYIDNVLSTVIDHSNHDHHHSEDYDEWQSYLNRPHPDVATVNQYFHLAATEFGVPVELLQIIGQIENNWTQIGPSIDRGWGIMHLVSNDYCNTLRSAAALLQVSEQTLKDDPYQNIRGAAALLASFAGPSKGKFTKLEHWFDAVAQFSGLINDELRFSQAERYYTTLKKGITSNTVWGETITIAPHPSIDISHITPPVSNQNKVSADYGPALSQITGCNFTGYRNTGIDTWVNHWIGVGTYSGAVSYFQSCNAGASAHFVIRSSDGQITQVVRIHHTAWHAGASGYNNNHRSIGVEHEATAANPGLWNSNAMVNASATMACYFSELHNIPQSYSLPGVRGHNDMPGTATQCPGTIPWSSWWNYFNAACSSCPANLNLTGTIGNGTYLAGNNITATGVVPAGSNVTANAGTSVTLNPGFDGRNNFTAQIGGCSNVNSNDPTASFKTNSNWTVTSKQSVKMLNDNNQEDIVLSYDVPTAGAISLELVDDQNTVIAQQQGYLHTSPGTYVIRFSKNDIPSGNYEVKIRKK